MTLGEGLGKQAVQMLVMTVQIHNRSLQFPLACIRGEMTIYFAAVNRLWHCFVWSFVRLNYVQMLKLHVYNELGNLRSIISTSKMVSNIQDVNVIISHTAVVSSVATLSQSTNPSYEEDTVMLRFSIQ